MDRHTATSSNPRRPALPRSVWVLSWVSCFADISGEMITPLLPLFLVSVLGSSGTRVGMIEGGAVLVVSLMTAYSGLRSDRSGRRVPWIKAGYGLPVLGKFVVAAATGWPMVMGGRLLDRFGKGLRGAPRDALIANAVGTEQRGRAFGVHRALDTMGALSGVLLSAFLLWWLGGTAPVDAVGGPGSSTGEQQSWVYRTIFAVGAGIGLVAFALTFLVRESAAPAGVSAIGPATAGPGPARKNVSLGLPRSYWLVLGVQVLFGLGNSADAFLLLRAHQLGFAPWRVALLYALFNVTYAGFSYPAGALSDRLGGAGGRWKVIAAGWGIYAAVYAGFAWVSPASVWAIWPLMAVYGVSMAMTEGVGKALIADHAPLGHRGRAIGLFGCILGVTTLVSSVLAGAMWDRFGPTSTFVVGAGFALVALIALAALRIASRSARGV